MTKNEGLKEGLKLGVSKDDELPRGAYFAPQSGGPQSYSLHSDDDERDPWDYDDYRDDDKDEEVEGNKSR